MEDVVQSDTTGKKQRCEGRELGRRCTGMFLRLAMLVLSVVLSVPASAQNLTTPEAGTRIRVVIAPDSNKADQYDTSGLFVLRTDSAIVLDRGRDGLDSIPASRVRRIDLQTSTRSAGTNFLRGMIFGATIGGGLGLLLGAAAHDSYSCSDGGFCMTAAGGGLLGGMLGTAVGSLIGLMYGPSEQWQLGETLSGIRAAPGHDGSLRLGISIMR
jgi:hypothetical protein